MSKPKIDSDGFQLVTSNRFSQNKRTKLPSKYILLPKPDTVVDAEKATRQIKLAVEDLQGSYYLKHVSESVSNLLQSRKVVEIVCFGLGHIAECKISRYQLSLLLCLKDLYSPEKVLAHDPIFYKSECQILKQLGLEVIEQNTEGSYVISDQNITLVYMPHCSRQLTNNFLWSNWGKSLQNCLLICNSFTNQIDNQPSRIASRNTLFIYKLFPQTSEIILENNFKYSDIFNDTSIHSFPKDKLDSVDSQFWIKGDKPQYEDDTDQIITSAMIKKLNV